MKQETFCYECSSEVDIEIDGYIVDIEDVEILCDTCHYYREIMKERNKAELRKLNIRLGKDLVQIWDGMGHPEHADTFLKAQGLTREDLV